MTSNLTILLDDALAKQQEHEPLYAILSQYSEEAQALRPLLETAAALETLNPVVLPDDATMAIDRDIFLTHVRNLPPADPVSLGALVRLKGWIAQRLPSKSAKLQQKELRPMSALLIKAALVLTMIFSATGGAAAFSTVSLPDSPLYPLKLTVEEVRLALAGDSAARAALHLAFAQERAEEIARVVQAGKAPNEPVQEQLQHHWQNALRLMAQAPEPAMLDLLLQADELIQLQERTTEQIQANAAIAAVDPLQWQRGLMAQVRLVVSLALQDPQTFRQQNGNLFGENDSRGPLGPSDEVPTGPGTGGFRPGPGGPYGPGDGSCEGIGECEGNGPGDGEPNDPGSGDGYGPGPGEPQGPGPGGPGDGDGDGNGPGEPSGPGNDDPQGPGPGDDDPQGPGPGGPNGPGDGDGDGDGPGEPNGPGNDDPQGPGPGGPNGPGDGDGDGEPNGLGDGNCEQPTNCNGDNGQNGGDGGQNGGDNGQNGGGNGEGSGGGGNG